MSSAASPRDIAIAFSGWLNVTVPDDGLDARRFLVDPLGADVFVAGTYLANDCASGGECLLQRLRHLQPLTGVQLAPMLTHEQLVAHAHSAPAFDPISRAFKVKETFKGLNLFAPVLGNPNVSCMRELHDLHRVFALITAHERSRGAAYGRLIFSRLEFRWLAPHPPLALLEPEVLWVPSGQNVNGVNDRHAVMHRMHAPTYFGRWELLLSDQLLKARPPWPPRPWPPRPWPPSPARSPPRSPPPSPPPPSPCSPPRPPACPPRQRMDLVTATHVGPEQLLGIALAHSRIRAGFFPNVAHLACCEGYGRCFASECHEKPSRQAHGPANAPRRRSRP